MKILAWIFTLLVLAWIDVPKMWQKKDWFEIWIFGGILILGVTYGILFQLDIRLPDPNGLERMIFEPIGKKLMKPAD